MEDDSLEFIVSPRNLHGGRASYGRRRRKKSSSMMNPSLSCGSNINSNINSHPSHRQKRRIQLSLPPPSIPNVTPNLHNHATIDSSSIPCNNPLSTLSNIPSHPNVPPTNDRRRHEVSIPPQTQTQIQRPKSSSLSSSSSVPHSNPHVPSKFPSPKMDLFEFHSQSSAPSPGETFSHYGIPKKRYPPSKKIPILAHVADANSSPPNDPSPSPGPDPGPTMDEPSHQRDTLKPSVGPINDAPMETRDVSLSHSNMEVNPSSPSLTTLRNVIRLPCSDATQDTSLNIHDPPIHKDKEEGTFSKVRHVNTNRNKKDLETDVSLDPYLDPTTHCNVGKRKCKRQRIHSDGDIDRQREEESQELVLSSSPQDKNSKVEQEDDSSNGVIKVMSTSSTTMDASKDNDISPKLPIMSVPLETSSNETKKLASIESNLVSKEKVPPTIGSILVKGFISRDDSLLGSRSDQSSRDHTHCGLSTNTETNDNLDIPFSQRYPIEPPSPPFEPEEESIHSDHPCPQSPSTTMIIEYEEPKMEELYPGCLERSSPSFSIQQMPSYLPLAQPSLPLLDYSQESLISEHPPESVATFIEEEADFKMYLEENAMSSSTPPPLPPSSSPALQGQVPLESSQSSNPPDSLELLFQSLENNIPSPLQSQSQQTGSMVIKDNHSEQEKIREVMNEPKRNVQMTPSKHRLLSSQVESSCSSSPGRVLGTCRELEPKLPCPTLEENMSNRIDKTILNRNRIPLQLNIPQTHLKFDTTEQDSSSRSPSIDVAALPKDNIKSKSNHPHSSFAHPKPNLSQTQDSIQNIPETEMDHSMVVPETEVLPSMVNVDRSKVRFHHDRNIHLESQTQSPVKDVPNTEMNSDFDTTEQHSSSRTPSIDVATLPKDNIKSKSNHPHSSFAHPKPNLSQTQDSIQNIPETEMDHSMVVPETEVLPSMVNVDRSKVRFHHDRNIHLESQTQSPVKDVPNTDMNPDFDTTEQHSSSRSPSIDVAALPKDNIKSKSNHPHSSFTHPKPNLSQTQESIQNIPETEMDHSMVVPETEVLPSMVNVDRSKVRFHHDRNIHLESQTQSPVKDVPNTEMNPPFTEICESNIKGILKKTCTLKSKDSTSNLETKSNPSEHESCDEDMTELNIFDNNTCKESDVPKAAISERVKNTTACNKDEENDAKNPGQRQNRDDTDLSQESSNIDYDFKPLHLTFSPEAKEQRNLLCSSDDEDDSLSKLDQKSYSFSHHTRNLPCTEDFRHLMQKADRVTEKQDENYLNMSVNSNNQKLFSKTQHKIDRGNTNKNCYPFSESSRDKDFERNVKHELPFDTDYDENCSRKVEFSKSSKAHEILPKNTTDVTFDGPTNCLILCVDFLTYEDVDRASQLQRKRCCTFYKAIGYHKIKVDHLKDKEKWIYDSSSHLSTKDYVFRGTTHLITHAFAETGTERQKGSAIYPKVRYPAIAFIY